MKGFLLRILRKNALSFALIILAVVLFVIALSYLTGPILIVVSMVAFFIMFFGLWQSTKKDAVESAVSKHKLQQISNELEDLKKRNASLQHSNKVLRSKKINISKLKPLVELGMFEAETQYTQFVNHYFDSDFNEIFDEEKIQLLQKNPEKYSDIYKDNPIHVMGALHFTIDAIYGIKFDKVDVKVSKEKSVVYVYGARPQFLSFKSRNVAWKNPITLRYNSPLIGKEGWKTDAHTSNLSYKFLDDYKLQVIKESEQGPEQLEWIKKPLEGQITNVLEMLFFKGYEIVHVDEKDNSFMSLNTYANSDYISSDNAIALQEMLD